MSQLSSTSVKKYFTQTVTGTVAGNRKVKCRRHPKTPTISIYSIMRYSGAKSITKPIFNFKKSNYQTVNSGKIRQATCLHRSDIKNHLKQMPWRRSNNCCSSSSSHHHHAITHITAEFADQQSSTCTTPNPNPFSKPVPKWLKQFGADHNFFFFQYIAGHKPKNTEVLKESIGSRVKNMI